jgi:hypothetical protein
MDESYDEQQQGDLPGHDTGKTLGQFGPLRFDERVDLSPLETRSADDEPLAHTEILSQQQRRVRGAARHRG